MSDFLSFCHGKCDWRQCTRGEPCPICGRSGWCSVSTDGVWCSCRKAHKHGFPGGKLKTDDQGTPYTVFRLTDGPRPGSLPEPIYSQKKQGPRKADPDTLDLVYSKLLLHLPLEDRHTKNLQARGLDMSHGRLRHEIGYRTLPLKGRAQALARLIEAGLEKHLPGVPGCYVKEKDGRRFWTLAGSPGLLIPVRDDQQRIVGLVTRTDEKKKDKYRWLSSAGQDRGGPSPGGPLPVHVPLFAGDKTTVRITEGQLKADVATILSGILTIGTPGLGWRHAPDLVRQLGAKTVRVAYDADANSNLNVALAVRGLVAALQAEGMPVELELWDEKDGKGIDDLLAAGKTPAVLTGAAVNEAVARIYTEAARAAGIDPATFSTCPNAPPRPPEDHAEAARARGFAELDSLSDRQHDALTARTACEQLVRDLKLQAKDRQDDRRKGCGKKRVDMQSIAHPEKFQSGPVRCKCVDCSYCQLLNTAAHVEHVGECLAGTWTKNEAEACRQQYKEYRPALRTTPLYTKRIPAASNDATYQKINRDAAEAGIVEYGSFRAGTKGEEQLFITDVPMPGWEEITAAEAVVRANLALRLAFGKNAAAWTGTWGRSKVRKYRNVDFWDTTDAELRQSFRDWKGTVKERKIKVSDSMQIAFTGQLLPSTDAEEFISYTRLKYGFKLDLASLYGDNPTREECDALEEQWTLEHEAERAAERIAVEEILLKEEAYQDKFRHGICPEPSQQRDFDFAGAGP